MVEENKTEQKHLVKGMKQVEGKNYIQQFESKSGSWEAFNTPEKLIYNLRNYGYTVPSVIQNVAIKHIMLPENSNYLFQSLNGSGKTGAFAIPAIMKTDASNPAIQIIVIANTRELIRQIMQVMQYFTQEMGIVVSNGEGSVDCQILITSPNFLKDRVVKKIVDISQVKLVVIDEADEIFLQDSNRKAIITLK